MLVCTSTFGEGINNKLSEWLYQCSKNDIGIDWTNSFYSGFRVSLFDAAEHDQVFPSAYIEESRTSFWLFIFYLNENLLTFIC